MTYAQKAKVNYEIAKLCWLNAAGNPPEKCSLFIAYSRYYYCAFLYTKAYFEERDKNTKFHEDHILFWKEAIEKVGQFSLEMIFTDFKDGHRPTRNKADYTKKRIPEKSVCEIKGDVEEMMELMGYKL